MSILICIRINSFFIKKGNITFANAKYCKATVYKDLEVIGWLEFEIGNMISDKSEGITEIKWSVSGKIASIDWNGTKNLAFLYDASGQRVMKQLVNGATTTTTWYIRDASGNVMSTYSENAGALQLDETYIYGSSRIGSYNANLVLGQSTGGNDPIQMVEYFRGQIVYELSNHLGNVLAVITDRKIGSRLSGPGNWEHFEVDYKSFSDYYPYGMLMDGRSYSSNSYKFGMMGFEKDGDVKSFGNFISFGDFGYDPRFIRRYGLDPCSTKYPMFSPYLTFANNPILFKDPDGKEIVISTTFKLDGTKVINILVTGKLINESSSFYSKDQMAAYALRISEAIKTSYSISEPGVEINVTTNITAIESEVQILPTDHVFRIRNEGEIPDPDNPGQFRPFRTVGNAPLGENVVYLSNRLMDIQPASTGPFKGTGKSELGYATLERTASHEMGHSANIENSNIGGETHPKKGSMPGNLMNQTIMPDAGTELKRNQLLEIVKNYYEGRINKGKQKIE